MLATTASFLATVAAQVGSAFYNNARGKAHGKEMARKQLAFEEKVAREGIENARAEFAELCSFQRELEAEIQRDRLKLLSESLQTSLTLEAYEQSLNSWPLLVPPYVITGNSVFSLENSENKAIPLNCILTPSTDGNFNNNIYVKIEENLADFCSKYWNVSSNKSIRFLQETWREGLSDADTKRQNLYAHLKSVPTLVISPIIRDEKLIFRIYWWGLSPDANEVHIDGFDEFDPAISIRVTRAKKYTQEEISEITEQCTAKLSAFISYFADLYYWNFYKEAPSLPKLINSNTILLYKDDLKSYKSQLTKSLCEYSKSEHIFYTYPEDSAKYLIAISNIAEKDIINECISHYIKSKELNHYDLSSLQLIREYIDLPSDLAKQIDSNISSIENNVEIGYFLCIGKNDLIQTILNQKKKIPSARYAKITPINSFCSEVIFLDKKESIAISPLGFCSFIAVHPAFSLNSALMLNMQTSTISKFKDCLSQKSVLSITEQEVAPLLIQQQNFYDNLKQSFNNLHDELWNDKLSLIDISYDDIPNIIRKLTRDYTNADFCMIFVGYSEILDNYTLSIGLYSEKSIVGDRFSCRSNSLDKTLKNKLNNKTILKIKLK